MFSSSSLRRSTSGVTNRSLASPPLPSPLRFSHVLLKLFHLGKFTRRFGALWLYCQTGNGERIKSRTQKRHELVSLLSIHVQTKRVRQCSAASTVAHCRTGLIQCGPDNHLAPYRPRGRALLHTYFVL